MNLQNLCRIKYCWYLFFIEENVHRFVNEKDSKYIFYLFVNNIIRIYLYLKYTNIEDKLYHNYKDITLSMIFYLKLL